MNIKKLLNNNVIVRVDSFFGDQIKLQSGLVLFIDTTTQNPRYATTKGTVMQVPEKLVCIKSQNQHSLEWEAQCEIQQGDIS